MDNPWIQLPTEPPYLLSTDREAILRFNETASEDHIIHTESYPEPFIGLPDAPIMLLGLNPGTAKGHLEKITNPILLQAYKDNLHHNRADFPFYLLNSEIGGGGYEWWTAKLRPIL